MRAHAMWERVRINEIIRTAVLRLSARRHGSVRRSAQDRARACIAFPRSAASGDAVHTLSSARGTRQAIELQAQRNEISRCLPLGESNIT